MPVNTRPLLACLLFVLPACAQEYIALKGDLHCHSSFSPDSNVPVEEVIAAYTQAGYDFIALTEHNQIKHLRKDWSTDELMVLPGYELTLSAGHYNVFGIREFQRKFDMNKAELAEYFVYLKGLGALIQLDHPNAHPYASRYGYDLDIDMVEVINGNITADDLQTLGGQDQRRVARSERRPQNNGFTSDNPLYDLPQRYRFRTWLGGGPP